jgi:hypothetical protein
MEGRLLGRPFFSIQFGFAPALHPDHSETWIPLFGPMLYAMIRLRRARSV